MDSTNTLQPPVMVEPVTLAYPDLDINHAANRLTFKSEVTLQGQGQTVILPTIDNLAVLGLTFIALQRTAAEILLRDENFKLHTIFNHRYQPVYYPETVDNSISEALITATEKLLVQPKNKVSKTVELNLQEFWQSTGDNITDTKNFITALNAVLPPKSDLKITGQIPALPFLCALSMLLMTGIHLSIATNKQAITLKA